MNAGWPGFPGSPRRNHPALARCPCRECTSGSGDSPCGRLPLQKCCQAVGAHGLAALKFELPRVYANSRHMYKPPTARRWQNLAGKSMNHACSGPENSGLESPGSCPPAISKPKPEKRCHDQFIRSRRQTRGFSRLGDARLSSYAGSAENGVCNAGGPAQTGTGVA